MQTLLHIDSSINGEKSVSRQLSAFIVQQWLERHPDTRVDYLDLAVSAPNHLSKLAIGFRTPDMPASQLEEAVREDAVSEQLVSQFLAADVIVIGAPFYNFTIASQLKAWVDRILQPRRTFHYTANGPEGLAGGKKVIVASSRGGVYSTSEQGMAMEHQESFLRVIFGFVGITDVQFVHAEGTAMGPDAAATALQAAKEQSLFVLDSMATA
ncbi:FMN-dependent NADH-azoreductase [Alcaligenaceae bacterium 429]|nr:FMN-dependent NADH-azoreductase [Alcaligenaceae bacterium 429]